MSIAAKVVLSSGATIVALFFGIWGLWAWTNPNPCQTFWNNRSGNIVHDGHTFACYHGQIVGLRKTARMGQKGTRK